MRIEGRKPSMSEGTEQGQVGRNHERAAKSLKYYEPSCYQTCDIQDAQLSTKVRASTRWTMGCELRMHEEVVPVTAQKNHKSTKCVEHGVSTAVPVSPPTAGRSSALDFRAADPDEDERIKNSGVLTFHTVGCSGDFSDHIPQSQVAEAMVAQLTDPDLSDDQNGPATAPSFLFHLGDIVYKEDGKTDSDDVAPGEPSDSADQKQMYNAQFYRPYTNYGCSIFAIAGNHDGKNSSKSKTSAIQHFLMNFCAETMEKSADNHTDGRPAMTQPYVYWRLDTPLAYIVGLYSNIANGGILDDPSNLSNRPQYDWLVEQLKDVRRKNRDTAPRKAVLLAVHYPPYSGAANFEQRGNPRNGPTNASEVRPLGAVLQEAFTESGQRPDAVISAHAHLYQRLTYRHSDGWEIPYLIVGSGGHGPIESLWTACNGDEVEPQLLPFEAVRPPHLAIPAGDSAQVVEYNDRDGAFGFLRLAITSSTLIGEFFTAGGGVPVHDDSFSLDLTTHRVKSIAY